MKKLAFVSICVSLFLFIVVSSSHADSKIDVNSASAQDFMTISGIGEKTAQNIIDYRKKIGKFTKLEQLMEVKGIGQSTFDKIKDQLTIGGGGSTTMTGSEKSSGTKMSSPKGKININTASAAELIALPGIGEKTAEKIIAYRKENGKFKKIEDIQNVKGIAEKKFEKIKNMITVN